MADLNEFVQVWQDKKDAANRAYKLWSEKFKCAALEQYYEGFQWTELDDMPYMLNMFYATIETQAPSLLFQNPGFQIKPRPSALKLDSDTAYEFATNLNDAVLNWMLDDNTNFGDEIESVILDSRFRFGIMEVGYSADWIDNPNADKPVLRSDRERNADPERNVIQQPKQLPSNERIYVRHINADRFRVSAIHHKYLNQCDWCGYYDFVRLQDLQANPDINLDKIKFTGFSGEDTYEAEKDEKDPERIASRGDYILVWKIWNNREKKKYLFSDIHNEPLRVTSFERLPFVDLRFKRRLKGFYPIPPTFNWISPQNEINETRETHRMHRRRFKRIYTLLQDAADYDEVQKAINGSDGTIISVKQREALNPVPNADLGQSAGISLSTSLQDFTIVSGTSNDQRGQPEETTATQAAIIDRRSSIRESRERVQVALFLVKVIKQVIFLMRNHLVNPIDVASSQGNEAFLSNVESEPTARTINPLTDFGDEEFDFDVIIAVESMSPVANEEELEKLLRFLSLLTQFPQFSLSPVLIRELAFRSGYHNEKVIREFQMMAQLQLVSQVSEGMGNLQSQGNLAQNTVAEQTPPDVEETENQLRQQGIPIEG